MEKHEKQGELSGCKGFPMRLGRVVQAHGVRAFARATGLSEGVIRKYINGESYPTLDRLEKIAAAAGVSFTWLATGEDFPVAGVRFDETAVRITGLARQICLHVVAINVGLVAANPDFAPHQDKVIPHVLSEVPFAEFVVDLFSDLEARGLWGNEGEKDRVLHDAVQAKLVALYEDSLAGIVPSQPRWFFALKGAGSVGR